MAFWTAFGGGKYSSKKRFRNAGNTSVVLSPVTSFSTGKICGTTSMPRYRFFTAVNAGKNYSQRFPHAGHQSRYPQMVRCSSVERGRDSGGELLVLLTQTCARVKGNPSHPVVHEIINSYHALPVNTPPTLRRSLTTASAASKMMISA
jgi:hypothetical protein